MKQIKNYEGYFITREGEVWSNKKKNLIQLTPKNDRGYCKIQLWNNGKSKNFFIHRLVAEAFIPNPHNLTMIDHIDDNKSNNNVTNLQWITNQGNTEKEHAYYYKVLRVASGEIIEVYNLKKWCRDNGLIHSSMRNTKKFLHHNPHRGYRLL